MLAHESEIDRLLKFLRQTALRGRRVTLGPDTPLFASHLLHSMNILDLIGYVERRLNRRLDEADLVMANFQTPRAIAQRFLYGQKRAA